MQRRQQSVAPKSFYVSFLLLISSAEGFLPSTISGNLQIVCQSSSAFSKSKHAFCLASKDGSQSSSSCSSALQVTRVASEETKSTNDENEPWWKSYHFQDEELAKLTRPHFPILNQEPTPHDQEGKPLIYLDSAATSQKPTYVTDKLTWYYHTVNSNVHRGAHKLSREATNMYEAARDSIATFVHARSRNEIIYTSGATEAINLVAYAWGRVNLQPGDEIILTVAEHHSNIVPWQIVAEQTGAVLKFVPIKSSEEHGDKLDWEGAFPELVTQKTKLVSFQHASNVLGCVNPVQDIVQMVKHKNPKCVVMLDACQSVPHQPVDVQALGVDFLAASGHKMCGPTGIGFLWGREELLNSMPPFMGGGEMINEVFLTHSTYAPAPGRFEAGTPPIAQAIGLGAAADYLTNIGMDRISAYEHELAEYLHKRMKEVHGIRILGPPPEKRTAIVAFVAEDVHPSDLSTFLDMEGIAIRAGHHCCQPLHREFGISHSARASLYFYNTKEEIDIFIEKLEETLSFFRSVGEGGGSDGFF